MAMPATYSLKDILTCISLLLVILFLVLVVAQVQFWAGLLLACLLAGITLLCWLVLLVKQASTTSSPPDDCQAFIITDAWTRLTVDQQARISKDQPGKPASPEDQGLPSYEEATRGGCWGEASPQEGLV